MFRRILGTVAAITLVSACSTPSPTVETGPDAEVLMDNLHKVNNSRTDLAYIDPNADFSKYNKVLLLPLDMDNVTIKQPSSTSVMTRNQARKWELTDEDKRKFQDVFRSSMIKQLEEKGGYEIVDAPGEDVMTLQASVLGIAPNAPKDDNRSRAAGRTYVYTEGAGAIAVMVVFGDSESREILGLVKDSRATSNYWGRNNSVSNLSDLRVIFNGWALEIRNALDRVHGKK